MRCTEHTVREFGASAVYGPQKGATEEDLSFLDAALGHFSTVVESDLGDIQTIIGGGEGPKLEAYRNYSAHRSEARQNLMNHYHSRPDLSGLSGIQYGRSLDSRLSTKKMADAQNTKAAGMTASIIFQKQNAE